MFRWSTKLLGLPDSHRFHVLWATAILMMGCGGNATPPQRSPMVTDPNDPAVKKSLEATARIEKANRDAELKVLKGKIE
jgi:hypothetical protein